MTIISDLPNTTVPPPAAASSMSPWLVVVLLLVLLAGLLFGYDQGVISGALVSMKAALSLSALMLEVVTSWVTLGALFGALAGGELADWLGRKHAVLIAGVIFTMGSFVERCRRRLHLRLERGDRDGHAASDAASVEAIQPPPRTRSPA